MACTCAKKLADLLKALQGLPAPGIPSIPIPLEQLASTPFGVPPKLAMSAPTFGGLPPLPVSPATLANLSACAQANTAAMSGLGIDLTAPNAQAQIDATMGAMNANASSFLPLAALDPTPWLPMSQLATVAMNSKLAFGVTPFGGGGMPALQGALNANFGSGGPVVPPNAPAWASLSASANGLGVDLGQPGAIDQLALNANAVAKISVPPLAFSPAAMLNPLALLAALANILSGLGLNPFAPGFPKASADMLSLLPPFDALEIPAGMAGVPGGMSLGPLQGLSMPDLTGLNMGPLGRISPPKLGPLSAVASFNATCGLAGFPVASKSACAPSCPMSF
ncbi:MAG: hypothetical protein R3F34_12360 [Planctomycetota bacterium]